MSEINIDVTATDDASAVIGQVASNTAGSMDEIKSSSESVTNAVNQTTQSSRQTALAFNNVATSGTALYMSFERVQNSQVALDRANLMVLKSTESLDQAQKNYNETVTKYGVNSAQAKDALDKLNIAQEALRVSQERVDMAQRNLNNTMLSSAMTVIPSLITMVSSLSKALGGLSGMSETLSGIGSSAGEAASAVGVGGAAGAGALGAAAAVVAIPIAGQFAERQAAAIQANPELEGLMTIRGGGAMPTGTEVSTSTVGQVLQQSTQATTAVTAATDAITQAEATLAIIAEKGYFSYPGVTFQHGGIVTRPTLGLVGEAGPEAIIPLDKMKSGVTIQGPLINVEGSVDRATADYVLSQIEARLKNIILDPSSSQAPTTHKKIRFGA